MFIYLLFFAKKATKKLVGNESNVKEMEEKNNKSNKNKVKNELKYAEQFENYIDLRAIHNCFFIGNRLMADTTHIPYYSL